MQPTGHRLIMMLTAATDGGSLPCDIPSLRWLECLIHSYLLYIDQIVQVPGTESRWVGPVPADLFIIWGGGVLSVRVSHRQPPSPQIEQREVTPL